MRIGTLFSGIGSPEQGASRVYDDLDLVFACEWDKFARESFNANYEVEDEHFHKDIADMDGKQYKGKVDIIIGGSPCQDFSLAGLRKGIDGNRGVLIYEYFRIIDEVQPPIFIYENVKGMLSDKGGKTLKDFIQAFRDMGYYCHYDVLNTKDYGVPQNRERVFIVGFKDSEHYHRFAFADKVRLEKRLKDVLEDDVDEKYYLSDIQTKAIENAKYESMGLDRVNNENEACNCLTTMTGGNREPKIFVNSATSKGYEKATTGDSINLTHPQSKIRRGRVGKQVAQTLDCACNQAVVEPKIVAMRGRNPDNPKSRESGLPTKQMLEFNENGTSNCLTTVQKDNLVCEQIKESVRKNFLRDYEQIVKSDKAVFYSECESGFQDNKVCLTESACLRANNDNLFTLDKQFRIRKLTPRECFRLQDFPDTFKFVVSNSQLYKQAGNSISANMMEMIFRQIEKSRFESCLGGLF